MGKEAKEVKDLVDEFNKIKKAFADAKDECESKGVDVETCNADAKKTYEAAEAEAKAKIVPAILKSLTTLFSLKACLSIF